MPAKAGIHLRFGWQAKENLDSGLRRNDQRKSRLLVDKFRTPRLGAEGHSVYKERFKTSPSNRSGQFIGGTSFKAFDNSGKTTGKAAAL